MDYSGDPRLDEVRKAIATQLPHLNVCTHPNHVAVMTSVVNYVVWVEAGRDGDPVFMLEGPKFEKHSGTTSVDHIVDLLTALLPPPE